MTDEDRSIGRTATRDAAAQRTAIAVGAIADAFTRFRSHINPLAKGEPMPEPPASVTPSQPPLNRRKRDHLPAQGYIYTLTRDGVLLDAYATVRAAYAAAHAIVAAHPTQWRVSAAPGRWIGGTGFGTSILEIKEMLVK